MGRTKWGREKKIIFVPDPGGMLHLPPAVFLFWSPIFGADPGLRVWCRGACLSWGLSAGGQSRFSGFSGFEMRGAAKPGILGAELVDQLAGPVSGLTLARGLNSYWGMLQWLSNLLLKLQQGYVVLIVVKDYLEAKGESINSTQLALLGGTSGKFPVFVFVLEFLWD